MSERAVSSSSLTVSLRRPWQRVAAVGLAVLLFESGCGVRNGAEVSASESATPRYAAGPYCSDAPSDRAQPVRIDGGKLVVAIHGECSGDPNAPVGVYRVPRQVKEQVLGAFSNGEEMRVDCQLIGDSKRTDAVSTYKGPYHTSSDIWLQGTMLSTPELGVGNVPYSNTGFVVLQLAGIEVKAC